LTVSIIHSDFKGNVTLSTHRNLFTKCDNNATCKDFFYENLSAVYDDIEMYGTLIECDVSMGCIFGTTHILCGIKSMFSEFCCAASEALENASFTIINIAMYVAGAVSLMLLAVLLVFIVGVRLQLKGRLQ